MQGVGVGVECKYKNIRIKDHVKLAASDILPVFVSIMQGVGVGVELKYKNNRGRSRIMYLLAANPKS
jgi:hypothetical protein